MRAATEKAYYHRVESPSPEGHFSIEDLGLPARDLVSLIVDQPQFVSIEGRTSDLTRISVSRDGSTLRFEIRGGIQNERAEIWTSVDGDSFVHNPGAKILLQEVYDRIDGMTLNSTEE